MGVEDPIDTAPSEQRRVEPAREAIGASARRPLRPASDANRSRAVLTLVALLMAGLVVWALMTAVAHWRERASTERTVRANAAAREQSQRQDAALQREADERVARREAQLREQEAEKLRAIAARQREAEETTRAAAEAIDRKEKAWIKFYRKPAGCNDAATLDCANSFIRSKRVFEEKYERGEL